MLTPLTDKAAIASFLRTDPALYFYELGDLDPFFWPHTRWFGWQDNGSLQAIGLLYHGVMPTLLLSGRSAERIAPFAAALREYLPDRLHSHIATDTVDALEPWRPTERRSMLKMSLVQPRSPPAPSSGRAEKLGPADLPMIRDLFEQGYPDNWFEEHMLATGHYYGFREHGDLLAMAGVHVYSAQYETAALGNIVTAPSARGRGLASYLTAHLCEKLLPSVRVVGLHVAADNAPAVRCYQKIGFETVAPYEEIMLEKAPTPS